ncbi:MAG: energy-coupling factor transporter transmembrane protein EcfT [Ruminococcaceae bacterium]|nr:energy-coupling factor transporter transmembrane protein EcfT [Oscillospiraceae bacterium]
MKITIGQYVPGNSILHRADPRTKFVLTFAYMIAVMIADNFAAYAVATVFVGAAYLCAKINIAKILRSLKPLIIMMLITVTLNILFYKGETVLVDFWKITIYKEGILFAVRMLLRIVLLVLGSSVLMYTTTSVMLTDGIESLLAPLKKIHFPAHEIAMMMSIALRFIPTFVDETDRIMKAQMARGTDFDDKNFIKKIKSYIPILIPLFISAWRKAEDLATAMNARCYRGGEGRTKFKVLKFSMIDLLLLLFTIILFAAIVLLNNFV